MNYIGALAAGGTTAGHVQDALVFLLEGLGVNSITATTNPAVAQSMYDPNQYAIAQGIFDLVNSLATRSRLARNLQTGDTIHMVVHTAETISVGDQVLLCGNINVVNSITTLSRETEWQQIQHYRSLIRILP
jgi:hypothetical protein